MFKVRTHDSRSVGWWYTQKDEIDLTPPYQRSGGLWTIGQKAYLIDSIINEYDIPKIYLADFTIFNSALNVKHRSYAVIDGRQRLEAIFGFRDDVFGLNEDFVLFSDPSIRLGGITYTELSKNHPKIADRFREFNLHVMSVITDDEAKINDLFVRLNSSKPLTGAEIRNAMSGQVPQVIRELVSHTFFQRKTRFSTSRGQDKNAAAKILLLEHRGKFVDTKKVHLDRFVEEGIKSENFDLDRAKSRANSILDSMQHIFADKDPLLASQGPLPLYYWFIRTFGAQEDIRDFLCWFENERIRNRRLAKDRPDHADQQFLSFDILNRSVDDQASYTRRFEILSRYYEFAKKSKTMPQQGVQPDRTGMCFDEF